MLKVVDSFEVVPAVDEEGNIVGEAFSYGTLSKGASPGCLFVRSPCSGTWEYDSINSVCRCEVGTGGQLGSNMGGGAEVESAEGNSCASHCKITCPQGYVYCQGSPCEVVCSP